MLALHAFYLGAILGWGMHSDLDNQNIGSPMSLDPQWNTKEISIKVIFIMKSEIIKRWDLFPVYSTQDIYPMNKSFSIITFSHKM